MNTSIPGFCRPIALSMPALTSATRGVGFPGHGTLDTPLVTIPPSPARSINSAYSRPDPKVPEAVNTGFLNVTPAMVTDISGFCNDILCDD